jgi:hypothetical protein
VDERATRSASNDRVARIGANEALFRAVNDEVRNLSESFPTPASVMSAICECGDSGCIERFDIPLDDYEQLRADSTLFAVRPGHEIPDVEAVVERHDEYWVVRKRDGLPALVAVETDLRRP